MGELTPTNEETLIEAIMSCPENEYILLSPAPHNSEFPSMINMYRIPRDYAEKFNYMNSEERSRYWKGGFLAVAFHKDVWTADPYKASRYR